LGAPADLVIRDGTVVGSGGRTPRDVYIRSGRIAAVRPHGEDIGAAVTIDASGLYVLPGMVDTHVHLMDPGDPSREDFPTGTSAAVANGVTTIVEHTHGWPVTSVERLAEKRAHLRGRSHTDYGLAAHLWDDNLDELPGLWRAGITFVKIFTCETHGVPATPSDRMLAAFEILAALDAVCLVHCEDDWMTARNESLLRDAGRTDGRLIYEWRTREAELTAVGAVALIARLTGARATIAHASSDEVLSLLEDERRRGARVVAETCPQYLLLKENEVIDQGAFRKFTPPARIRGRKDEEAMWAGLREGRVHHLSTDHAPSTRAQKSLGVWASPFGLPGLDSTLPLMLDAALAGRITLERLVEIYAEAPALWYGLDRKGKVSPGYDADLVIVDPTRVRTLTDDAVISKAGWTPFAGRQVRGGVKTVLLRGTVVAEDGRPEGSPSGRFLAGPGAR
jgi:dihydroorotase (multifunctional complex type)